MQVTKGMGTVVAAYISCLLALGVFPVLFGVLAFVLGLINIYKGFHGHGAAQLVLSIAFAVLGIMLSQWVWQEFG